MENLRTSLWVTICMTTVILVAGLTVACKQKSATETTQRTERIAAGALAPSSWIVPQDVKPSNGTSPSQTDWSNFAWQTFVALDWPSATPGSASGIAGLPNTQLAVGASSSNAAMIPTVWLTFRSESNTMLAEAQNPGSWSNNPLPVPSGCSALSAPNPISPGFQPMVLNMTSKTGAGIGNKDEASGPPLIGQSGWFVTYDIRLDQSEYTYIQQNGYYNAVTQQNAEKNNGQLVGLPQTGKEAMFNPPLPALAQFGALEVKAAWRVLDPVKDKAIIPRYYTQGGYFLQQDGTCEGQALFGLIGLHILRLTPTTPATWFWATFEQVDNVTPPPSGASPATLAAANTPNGNCGTGQYNQAPSGFPPNQNIPWDSSNPPVNVCQVTNVSSSVQQVNQNWQSNLAGTVWQNYQLIDTINPSVQGGPTYSIPISNANVNTNILANTAMETYVQGSGPGNGQSCMDCHAYATPQGATQNSTNQVFTFLLSNATAPAGVTAAYRKYHLPQNVLRIIQGMRKLK